MKNSILYYLFQGLGKAGDELAGVEVGAAVAVPLLERIIVTEQFGQLLAGRCCFDGKRRKLTETACKD